VVNKNTKSDITVNENLT